MKLLAVSCCLAVATFLGNAQDKFEYFEGSVELSEGGSVKILTILSDNYRFTLAPPLNFNIGSDKQSKKISFTVPDKISISAQITSDYPGGLPDEETLKQAILQQYVGAAVLRSDACYVGGTRGWLVDVKRVLDENSSLIIRHVFVPWSGGTEKFIFSTSNEDFQSQRNTFGNLLNSFHVEPFKPKAKEIKPGTHGSEP